MEFTSREIASGAVFVSFICLMVFASARKRELWRGLRAILKLVFPFKISAVIISYITYFAASVLVAHKLNLWSLELAKDTVFIFLFSALPLLFNIGNVGDGKQLFATVLRDTLGITALLVTYLELSTLPFLAEFVIQVLFLFLLLLSLAARH